MNLYHTPDEVKEIYEKESFARDLLFLQRKYKLNMLSHIIDRINAEVKIELDKYKSYIGKPCRHLYSDNPHTFFIIDFMVAASSIYVQVKDDTMYFNYPAEDIELI